MKCVALWYGGSNYSAPDPSQDLERFDSIAAAARTFEARLDDRHFPCVDEDAAEMHVYFGRTYHDNGPDRIITAGPRGGIKVNRC